MTLDSPKVTVNKSTQELFDFLTNVENFKTLMPENISKFEIIDDTSFVFALKGMPEIPLKIKETVPPTKIVLGAGGGKVDFDLIANIETTEDNKSAVKLSFTGSFNPMMAMMIKGPISKFIETLTTNMAK